MASFELLPDTVRDFRLADDKFFLMAVGGGGITFVSLAGDAAGALLSSILPLEPVWVNAGVAGDSLFWESFECIEVIGVIGTVPVEGGPAGGKGFCRSAACGI